MRLCDSVYTAKVMRIRSYICVYIYINNHAYTLAYILYVLSAFAFQGFVKVLGMVSGRHFGGISVSVMSVSGKGPCSDIIFGFTLFRFFPDAVSVPMESHL